MRHSWLYLSIVAFIFTSLWGTRVAMAATTEAKPNFLVILIDDLGYRDVGAYGSKDIPTPHIDSLASNGVRFTSGYSTCFYCSPSRAGLLTGRYQQRYGLEYVGGKLDVRERTLADLLREQGYATAALGKWHVGEEPPNRPRNRGFDYFFGYLGGFHYYNLPVSPELIEHPTDPWITHATYGGSGLSQRGAAPIFRNEDEVQVNGYLTEALTHEALTFLERNRQRPFFLYFAHAAQHAPLQATEKYLNRFANLNDAKLRRTYAATLSAVDDSVGEVLAKLKELELDKNTVVVFTSDNGGPSFWESRPEIIDTIRSGVFSNLAPRTGEYDLAKLSEQYQWNAGANGSDNLPLSFGKMVLHEGGIRIPFIIQWPGVIPAGRVSEDIVSHLDLVPTFVTAAGGKLPTDREYDGIDLRPLLEGKAGSPADRTLFWRIGRDRAVRGGRWKLIWSGDAEPRLYDLSNDVREEKNLAAEHREIVEKLQAEWIEWNKKNIDPPLQPAPIENRGKTADAGAGK